MRKVLTGLVLAFSVACLNDGVTGSSTVTGDYTLRTINGSPLPYTIVGSGTEIIDDVISLYQGGTYAESGHSRTTVNGQVTNASNTDTGSHILLGTSITFHSSDGGLAVVAQSDATTMTILVPGLTKVFSK
jgi:hypothetical protein